MYQEAEQSSRIASALLEIARVRYEAFRDRFGRDPEVDEPLLFDPSVDEPIAANASDRTLQIVSAAMLCNIDAWVVLDYLGLNQIH
jgi:hypothetical protein